jgi:hypothetical protein
MVRANWLGETEANCIVDWIWAPAKDGKKPSAKDWLIGHLMLKGEQLRDDVLKAGEDAGHNVAALLKAAGRCKYIKARHEDVWQGRWLWRYDEPDKETKA